MKQKRRTIHTLSSKPKVQQQVTEPVVVATDEAPPETYQLEPIKYDANQLAKQFEGYTNEYYTQILELILRHQAMRSAILQIKTVTDKEFVSGFVDLDDDMDEGIAEAFKLGFFRLVLNDINKHSHPDNPIDVLAALQLLYFPHLLTPPKPPEQKPTDLTPVVKYLATEFKRLNELVRESVGPFGMKGEPHVEPTKSRLVRRTNNDAARPRSKSNKNRH